MRYLPVVLIYFSCFCACQMEKTISLEPYGLPIELSVPNDARIMEMDLIVTKDVQVRSKGFYLQFLTLPDSYLETKEVILENMCQSVVSDTHFIGMESENTNGFVYAYREKEGKTAYNFRQLIELDSIRVLAKAGESKTFSLDQVKKMHKAVMEAKSTTKRK